MSLKVHLPSTENHGSQVLGENVGRRVGGSTGVGRGGRAAPSSCCQGAPAGRSGISIIIFPFKASLTENYKLICSLNTQVRDKGASGRAG